MIILNKKIIIKLIKRAGTITALFLLIGALTFGHKKASASNKNNYEILVDVEESVLYLINNGVIEKTYSCSGGKWATPSPIGTWKITQKATWGEGFRRTLDGLKCTMGQVWNTWDTRSIFSWLGKLTWMYKNE